MKIYREMPASCFLVRGNFRNIRLPLSLRIVLATSFKALRFPKIIGRNELFIVQLLAGRLIYDKSQDLKDQAKDSSPESRGFALHIFSQFRQHHAGLTIVALVINFHFHSRSDLSDSHKSR